MLDFSFNCSARIATGQVDCENEIKEIYRYILTKKRWKASVSNDTIDSTYVANQVKCGDWIPLRTHEGIESITKEPVYGETSRGVDVFTRGAIYGELIEFAPWSPCYANELAKIQGNYNILLVDSDGKLYGAVDGDVFKGFDLHSARVHDVRANNGTDYSRNRFRIQYTPQGSIEMEKNIAILQTDVNFLSLEGIINLNVEVLNSTAGNVEVKVTEGCNKSTPVNGLESGLVVLNSSGEVTVATWAAGSQEGTYTTTDLSTPGDYTVQISDAVNLGCAFTDVLNQSYYASPESFTLA